MADSSRKASEVEYELRKAHERLDRLEAHVLREFGLTVEQYRVLKIVEMTPTIGVSEVAGRLTRSINSVSMLVDRMVKAQLLKRVRSKTDRRGVVITLTRLAKMKLGPASARHIVLLEAITSKLGAQDIEDLLSLLRDFQTAMLPSENVI